MFCLSHESSDCSDDGEEDERYVMGECQDDTDMMSGSDMSSDLGSEGPDYRSIVVTWMGDICVDSGADGSETDGSDVDPMRYWHQIVDGWMCQDVAFSVEDCSAIDEHMPIDDGWEEGACDKDMYQADWCQMIDVDDITSGTVSQAVFVFCVQKTPSSKDMRWDCRFFPQGITCAKNLESPGTELPRWR